MTTLSKKWSGRIFPRGQVHLWYDSVLSGHMNNICVVYFEEYSLFDISKGKIVAHWQSNTSVTMQ